MADRKVARRIEIRLPAERLFPTPEELEALGSPKNVTVDELDRREHVRRLDLALTGGLGDVDRVVETLSSSGAQIMRDEVLAPGAPEYPDPEAQVRIAAPAEPVAGEALPAPTNPVIVAIVDTGIMAGHPDLAGHLWTDTKTNPGAHGVSMLAKWATIQDEDGHGTLLAGTVLAGANRSPAVRLMTVKFFDGRTRPDPDLGANAINWAVDHGAHIINLSWAVGIETPALRRAVERAGERGVLVVVAAGNSGADNDRYPSFPANYAQSMGHVITVMATDDFDDRPGFSNYGDTSVHISAPGMRVVSTHAYLAATLEPGGLGRYQRYDGTSASAAYVAGAAALLRSVCPAVGPKELSDRLVSTADPSRDPRRGAKPRLNVRQACAAVEAHCRRLPAHPH